VNSVAVCTDGSHIASGGKDGAVRVWDAANDRAVTRLLRGRGNSVSSVA
jgi:WD40 repeat protein